MIGSKILAAAVLLPTLVTAIPNDLAHQLNGLFTKFKDIGYLENGKIDFKIACVCRPQSPESSATDQACAAVTSITKDVHELESILFCAHGDCNAKYDPVTGLCQCSWNFGKHMKEEKVWPGKNCEQTITCFAPYQAHWDPHAGSCACAIDTSPTHGRALRFEPSAYKEYFYGPNQHGATALAMDKAQIAGLTEILTKWTQPGSYPASKHTVSTKKPELKPAASENKHRGSRKVVRSEVRQASSDAVSLAPLPTYIPPPNTEVTQELIQESLLLQPQKVAVVSSAIPHFADGVISFLVQLDGPISQTLTLNATDTLPCENIGTQPQPNLTLVPKTVKNGTSVVALSDCLVIAVNVYDPRYITYWVQKSDGSVFSLLSDNKIHAIDQLDTSLPASVAIRVAHDDSVVKRGLVADVDITPLSRRQIYAVKCGQSCPFYHMQRINSNSDYCGCMFKSPDQDLEVVARSVEQPSPYTATMTAEACAAMTCINNGGNPALFNPFTATCWCTSPTYVEHNDNAYNGGS